jgi:osmotically-inducible protein OsmY
MKTDLGLLEVVAEELSFDPSVDAARIGIAAKDGVVTLTGKVASYAEKIAAEKSAKRVSGVKGVAQGIEVDLPAFHRKTFERSAQIDANHVVVKTENGTVKLYGSVHSWAEHDDAANAAYSVPGVTDVENHTLVIA